MRLGRVRAGRALRAHLHRLGRQRELGDELRRLHFSAHLLQLALGALGRQPAAKYYSCMGRKHHINQNL